MFCTSLCASIYQSPGQRNGVVPPKKSADVSCGHPRRRPPADREARPGCSGPGKPLTGAAPSTARSAWYPTGGGGPDRGGKATVPKRGPAPPSPISTARGRVARAQALSAEHRATLEQKPRGQTRRAPPGLDTEKAYDVRLPARLLRSSGRGAGARFSGKGRRKAG